MSGAGPDSPAGPDGRPVALEGREIVADGRRFSPSVARNSGPIMDAFRELAPGARRVLEIASGTGEHGIALTGADPGLSWTFSDPDQDAQASITAWLATRAGDSRLSGPLRLDMTDPATWSRVTEQPDTIVCINMIHIAPFAAAEGVFALAGRSLASSGRVFLYGPFARNGDMAESNRAFDASLKSRDPRWGVRDLDLEIVPLARTQGFALSGLREMPANNLSVCFARA